MNDVDAITAVLIALREITKLPVGAERECLLLRLTEDPALMVLVAQEEIVALALQGLEFAT